MRYNGITPQKKKKVKTTVMMQEHKAIPVNIAMRPESRMHKPRVKIDVRQA